MTPTSRTVPDDVAAYLDAAPEPWAELLRDVLGTLAAAMPDGYELGMHWGMPTWVVPLARFPRTYNGKPLAYVSVGAQKNHVSVYLMGVYSVPEEVEAFREAWRAGTGRVDMGKSCLRLRKPADVDHELLARTVAGMSVERFLETYERVQAR
ncbi:uncharacterized protein DUF1801 [Georgenia soli]|uniref:Uncharacterized protein DUF1801 n=1 Tax=Georgenia soli TaxID=638953 RepID=A0A2A9EKX3_9MICO|nr:DUF1801 domain-containing protein [Georgenia soli]PFG39443.1 uncharacterized protein DUF1801 [Georgenia soli]